MPLQYMYGFPSETPSETQTSHHSSPEASTKRCQSINDWTYTSRIWVCDLVSHLLLAIESRESLLKTWIYLLLNQKVMNQKMKNLDQTPKCVFL